MVESTALEMRHTGNRIGGSNPSLSAITLFVGIRPRAPKLINRMQLLNILTFFFARFRLHSRAAGLFV